MQINILEHMRYLLCLFFVSFSQILAIDAENMALDQFLNLNGYYLSPLDSQINEGYMTNAQKSQFEVQLKSYPEIKNVLEIGLNGGHSAEHFFQTCPKLANFVSFDIQMHSYTEIARKYLEKKYKNRFTFVKGDSLVTISEYARQNQEMKFDLIYIDGNHTFEYCLKDIQNCKALASPNTILWIDDFAYEVEKAVNACVDAQIIKIDKVFSSNDPCGGRCWVQAHYLFK